MATTKYNWKDITGANIRAQLNNVAKSYTTSRALHIIQLIHSIHKSWETIDQIRSIRGAALKGLTHGSFAQMLTLDKFIRMCDFDNIELDTITVNQLRKLLFNPPPDGSVDPGPNSDGLIGWYFPDAGPVKLCEVVNPYSDRNDEIQEAQDLLNDAKTAVGVHVLRFQLKKWCESNPRFKEVLQLKAANAQLEQEIFTFLNQTLRLTKSAIGSKPGDYLVKNAAQDYRSVKREPITKEEITEWTRLKNEYQRLNANDLLRENIKFPRIIDWALTTDWTLNGTQLSSIPDRKGGILHLLSVFGCGMNANQFDAIENQGLKGNVALTSQLNDFVGSSVADKQSRVSELTRDANSWLKTNAGHDALEAKGPDGICSNKLILQVLTTWKQGRIGFTNIGEEISLCFEDYHRFFLLPHPRQLGKKYTRVFDSYIEAKNYVVYGVTPGTLQITPSLDWYPGLNLTGPGARVKWRSYFQRSIRTPYKQYGEGPLHQEGVLTARNNPPLGDYVEIDPTPDQTNTDFSRLDRNPTPAIKAVQQAGVRSAGQCCAVCSKRMRNGSNKTWSTYLGGRSSGASAIGQSFDVDHIANLIYNELFKLNTGGHGFLNTCTGCNQHFKSEKIWCPSYNLWYYLLEHAYGELATLLAQFNASSNGEQYMTLTPDQFFACYPWPGWKINGIPGIKDRFDFSQEPSARLRYDASTKISEFNMYCTINSYGNQVPTNVSNSGIVPRPPRRPASGSKRNMWDQGQGMGSTKNAGSTRGMGDFDIVSVPAAKITALNLETIILDRFANIVRMMSEEGATYEGATLVNNIIKNEYNRLKLAMSVKGNTATGCVDMFEKDGGYAIATEYMDLTRQFPIVARYEDILKQFNDALKSGSVATAMHPLEASDNSREGSVSSSGTFASRVSEKLKQQQIIDGQEAMARGEALIASFRAEQENYDRMDIARVFPGTAVSRQHFQAFSGGVNTYLNGINSMWRTPQNFTRWSRDILRFVQGVAASHERRRFRERTIEAVDNISNILMQHSLFTDLNCTDLDTLMEECLTKLEETHSFIEAFRMESKRLNSLSFPNKEMIDAMERLQREFDVIVGDLIQNNIRFGLLYKVLSNRGEQVRCARLSRAITSLGPGTYGARIASDTFSQSQGSQGSDSSESEGRNDNRDELDNIREDAVVDPLAAVVDVEDMTGEQMLDVLFGEGSSNSSNNSLDVSDQSNTAEDDLEMHTPNNDDAVGLSTPEKPQGAAAVPPTPGSGNLGGDELGSPENEGSNTAGNQGIRRVIPYQSSSRSLGSAPRRSAFSAVSGVDESGSGNNQRPPSRKRERQGEGGEARPPSRLRGPYDGIGVFITSLFGLQTFRRGEWVDWAQVDNAITLLIRNAGFAHPNLLRVWQEQDSEVRRQWFIGYLNHIGATTPGDERQVRISPRGRFYFERLGGFGRGGRKRTRKKRRKKKKTKRRRKYRKKTKGRKRRRKKRTRRK